MRPTQPQREILEVLTYGGHIVAGSVRGKEFMQLFTASGALEPKRPVNTRTLNTFKRSGWITETASGPNCYDIEWAFYRITPAGRAALGTTK